MRLLSDDLVAKYRNLPNFLWYIFGAVSVFFANAYSYITSAGSSAAQFESVLAQTGMTVSVNKVAFIVLTCVFSAAFSQLIFELINHIASGILLARFSAKTSRADLKFRLRICFIYANLLTGLIGIAYFFTQISDNAYTGVFDPYGYFRNDVEMFLSYVVSFSSITFFVFVFFEDTRKRFLPARKQTSCLTFVGRIYFGISLVVTAIGAFTFVFNSLSVLQIVSDCIDFVVCALWAVAAYLYYLRLKNHADDDPNEDGQTVVIKEKTEHNIYDDFGF